MRYCVLIVAATAMLFCGCSKDKSTGPDNQDSIYLSRLVVSMVPGASETVTIHSTASTGEFEVSHSSPEVASVNISDSTLTVTGLSYGIDTLTITGGGASCILPVQVYNHRVIDTGAVMRDNDYSFVFKQCVERMIGIFIERAVGPNNEMSPTSHKARYGRHATATNAREKYF